MGKSSEQQAKAGKTHTSEIPRDLRQKLERKMDAEDRSRRAAVYLIGGVPVGMRMVPIQARRFIGRDLSRVLERWIGVLNQRVDHIVLMADRRNIESMKMQIRRVWCHHTTLA